MTERTQKTFKVYIPEQAGDLSTAVEAASQRLGLDLQHKVTTSDWIVMAINEKLERDIIPYAVRTLLPELTVGRIREMLVWENPGVGHGVSSDSRVAHEQAYLMMHMRLSCGQLCGKQVSLSAEDARWLLAHGARKAESSNEIHEAALQHAGLF